MVAPGRARVLIIDDDFEVLEVLRDIVSALGHDVQTAAAGTTGLERVPLFKPQFVLLDLAMPAPSGYEVLGALRCDYPAIPVIMVAAQVDAAISDRLIAKGAFAYVEKPFTMERLDAVIRGALQSRPALEWRPGDGPPPC
jgi:CheY-like chemotaxis protein